MKLNTIINENVHIASDEQIIRGAADILRGKGLKEIILKDVAKLSNHHCVFVDGDKGDTVVISKNPENLEKYNTNIMKVSEMLKRLDIKSVNDDTPIKFYITKT